MADQRPKDEHKDQRQKEKQEVMIIRISGRDINGTYDIPKALDQVKGLGSNLSHAIALEAERKLNIPMKTKLQDLSEEQIAKLEDAIKEPGKLGIPNYLFNRRKDVETGKDMHLVGVDLIVKTKQDIERDIKIQTYRGFRHQYGQKVRGQKTRSTGRTGATIGVTKKGAGAPTAAAAAEGAAAAQAASAPAPAKKAGPAPAAAAAKPEEKK